METLDQPNTNISLWMNVRQNPAKRMKEGDKERKESLWAWQPGRSQSQQRASVLPHTASQVEAARLPALTLTLVMSRLPGEPEEAGVSTPRPPFRGRFQD